MNFRGMEHSIPTVATDGNSIAVESSTGNFHIERHYTCANHRQAHLLSQLDLIRIEYYWKMKRRIKTGWAGPKF